MNPCEGNKEKYIYYKIAATTKEQQNWQVQMKCLTKPAAVFCGKSLAYRGWCVCVCVCVCMRAYMHEFQSVAALSTALPVRRS